MKITDCPGIFKSIYANASYVLLFGKKINKVLKFHVNNSSHFEIRTSLF